MEPFCRLHVLFFAFVTFFVALQVRRGFSITETDSYLANHVMRTVSLGDWLSCTLACHEDTSCISYNYNMKTRSCDLNDYGVLTSVLGTDLLIKKQGVVFHQIRVSQFCCVHDSRLLGRVRWAFRIARQSVFSFNRNDQKMRWKKSFILVSCRQAFIKISCLGLHYNFKSYFFLFQNGVNNCFCCKLVFDCTVSITLILRSFICHSTFFFLFMLNYGIFF